MALKISTYSPTTSKLVASSPDSIMGISKEAYAAANDNSGGKTFLNAMGKVGEAILARNQEEDNLTIVDAMDAYNKARFDLMNNQETGLMNAKGDGAKGIGEAYLQGMKGARDKVLENTKLHNPKSKIALERMMQQAHEAGFQAVYKHQGQQLEIGRELKRQDIFDTALKSTQDNIGNMPFAEANFNQMRLTLDASYNEMIVGKDVKDAALKQFYSKYWTGAADQALLTNNYAMLNEIKNKYGQYITASSRAALTKTAYQKEKVNWMTDLAKEARSVCGDDPIACEKYIRSKAGFAPTVGSATTSGFTQTDKQWANVKYAGGNIGTSGCAPTTMANMLSMYGINATPLDLANFSKQIGTGNSDGGTGWDFFKQAGEKYGVNVSQISDWDNVMAKLKAGVPVMAGHGKGEFTSSASGHWMLYTGLSADGTKIKVSDSRGGSHNGEFDISKVEKDWKNDGNIAFASDKAPESTITAGPMSDDDVKAIMKYVDSSIATDEHRLNLSRKKTTDTFSQEIEQGIITGKLNYDAAISKAIARGGNDSKLRKSLIADVNSWFNVYNKLQNGGPGGNKKGAGIGDDGRDAIENMLRNGRWTTEAGICSAVASAGGNKADIDYAKKLFKQWDEGKGVFAYDFEKAADELIGDTLKGAAKISAKNNAIKWGKQFVINYRATHNGNDPDLAEEVVPAMENALKTKIVSRVVLTSDVDVYSRIGAMSYGDDPEYPGWIMYTDRKGITGRMPVDEFAERVNRKDKKNDK